MPFGLVNDDVFNQELKRLKKVELESHIEESHPEATIIEKDRPGRTEGRDVNVPDSLRKLVGEESVVNGRQAALGLAGMFGISPSSVSAYAKGATSTTTYNQPTQSIVQHINKSRNRAIKRASRAMNQALGSITQDKLDNSDARELAGIAKDMSAIIKNLEPPQQGLMNDSESKPQFVVFAPQFRSENAFEVIDVKE
jgi:hypothetical protein